MPSFRWRPKKTKAEATPPQNTSESHSAASSDALQSQSPSNGPDSHSAVTASTSYIPAEDQPMDLWDRAYKLLRKDESNSKVLESYEKILLSELRDADPSQAISFSLAGPEKESQLSALITKKMQVMDDARWKFKVGNQTVEVKAQVDRVVKAVLFAKDFVSTAVSSEPHAALAWAGVCVLLPLLLNPSGQQMALAQGLDQISDIICRYTVIEETYHTQTAEASATSSSAHLRELGCSLEKYITKLYSQIILYQVRVARQLLRPAVVQFGRDVIKVDDWATLLLEIKETDLVCKGFSSVIDSQRLQHGFNEQARRREQLYLELQSNLALLLQTAENNAKDVKDNWQEQKYFRRSDEQSSFLQALYNSKYEEHKSRNLDRVPDTCQWFLRNQKYNRWKENKSSDLLWVTADPGCGKSVLSKSLVDNELRSSPSSTTCYFFFKDDSADQKSATKAICALLHQILYPYRKPVLLQKGVDVFKSRGTKMFDSFPILWELLLDIANDPEANEILCVLDALDECEEHEKKILINAVNRFYSFVGKNKYNGRLKFLITSRPYYDIEQQFDNLIIRLAGEDETELIKQEIDLVIRDRVPRLATKMKLDSATASILQQRLLDTENRTYLWLHLILEDVIKRSLRVKTPKRMEQFFKEIPATVYDAYDHILKRSPDPDDARKLLHIVLAADRPLTLREMNIALNIEEGQRCREEVDLIPEDTFLSYIKNICGLFVSIIDSRIYLLHQTAKEFLVSQGGVLECVRQVNVNQETWKHSMDPSSSNLVLATICLQYLSFNVFEDKPLDLDDRCTDEEGTRDNIHDSQTEDETEEDKKCHKVSVKQMRERMSRYCEAHEFLLYASTNWASHFRMARENELTSKLWFCAGETQSNRFRTWFALYWDIEKRYDHVDVDDEDDEDDKYNNNDYYNVYHDAVPTLTSITLASFFGHDTIVLQLIEEGQTDSTDSRGRTSLWWAAMQGYLSIVKMLIAKGAVQSKDHKGQTPLAAAAWEGHEEIVKLLINNGTMIESADEDNNTALSTATIYGNTGIVKLLLDRGAMVNHVGEFGRTPLHIAVHYALIEIVQLLLDNGAIINAKDDRGQTPLHIAVHYALIEIVQLLLDNGAIINAKDDRGQTPLHHASHHADPEIMQLLMDKGAIIDAKDNWGRTPLHIASIHKSTEIIQPLMDNGAFINAKDDSDQTPLHYASIDAHTEIVQLLLDNGAIINAKDDMGRTPLLIAANHQIGLKGVELLVMKGGADVNVQATDGRNPLSVAAAKGHQDIMRFLLAHGANPNPETDHSPLALAAENEHEEVVKILIANGADPNAKTRNGVTPLQNAEAFHLEWCGDQPCGHESIFRLLKPLTAVSVPPSVQEEEDNEPGSNELGDGGTESGEKPVSVGERDGRAEESL